MQLQKIHCHCAILQTNPKLAELYVFLGQAAPFGIPTEVVPSRLKALALPSKPTAQTSQKVIVTCSMFVKLLYGHVFFLTSVKYILHLSNPLGNLYSTKAKQLFSLLSKNKLEQFRYNFITTMCCSKQTWKF